MKPFPAWLAMDGVDPDGDAVFGTRKAARKWSLPNEPPQPVIIVPDTEENRKKLGMEE